MMMSKSGQMRKKLEAAVPAVALPLKVLLAKDLDPIHILTDRTKQDSITPITWDLILNIMLPLAEEELQKPLWLAVFRLISDMVDAI